MKAIWRLLATYFGGLVWQRWCTGLGLVMIFVGSWGLLLSPASPYWNALVIGICAVFFGASLMPVVVGQLISGHYLYLLPHGRVKLLCSVLAALTLLALVFAGLVSALYATYSVPHTMVFAKAIVVSFLTFSMMYVLLWFFSRAQTALGLLVGAMLLIASLGLPFRFIYWSMITSILWPVIGGGVVFALCIAAFLMAPRLKRAFAQRSAHGHALSHSYARSRAYAVGSARAPNRTARYTVGKELDLLVGTTRPWTLALGQIVPILIAGLFVAAPGFWLFYFALFSVIFGATTSFAAPRSRALWLRTAWSRTELFGQIERSFWRHHCYSLTALLLLFVAMGRYLGFSSSLLWLGLPLLVLGTTVSTYLGLMMTRGIGWWDSALAILTMGLLMAAAVNAANVPVDNFRVEGIEILLAALAWGYRVAAKRRWSRLDWMLCRPVAGDASRTSF
jgi:hypothetical protein